MKSSRRHEGLKDVKCRPCGGQGGAFQAALRIACRGCCEYFKGDGGEWECGGFSAVARGVASGVITARQIEGMADGVDGSPRRIRILSEKLCSACGYLKDGCDFQSTDPPEGATPCGGYRLIQALMEDGEITEEELGKILNSPTPNVQGKPV